MKAFYICDKKRGCRYGNTCRASCRWTTDAKHAQNKDKRERYFVIDPRWPTMEELETLQEMRDKAAAIIKTMSHNVT